MEKENIKMFFESQSTPPDSEKIEQWYIDNINNTELDTILLELLKKCTHQDEQKARCAFSRTCHRIGIGSPKVTQKRKIIYRWVSQLPYWYAVSYWVHIYGIPGPAISIWKRYTHRQAIQRW